MALYWQKGEPVRLEASCDPQRAESLITFDHHRVVVNDRWGILICYHWHAVPKSAAPRVLSVLLNPAPNHLVSETQVRLAVKKYPEAPAAIQRVIDELKFGVPEVKPDESRTSDE